MMAVTLCQVCYVISSLTLRYLVPNVTLSRPYVPCESALQADVGFLIYIIY